MADSTLVAKVVQVLEEYERQTGEIPNIWDLERCTSVHAKHIAQILMRHRLEQAAQAAFPPSAPDNALP